MARSARNANLQQARALHRSGDLKGAERGCRQILRRNPRNQEANRLLANVLRRTGRTDEAELLLRKALAVNAEHFDTLIELARTLWDLNRRDEACEMYRAASNAQPEHPEPYVRRAEVLASQISYHEAVRILESALERVAESHRSKIEQPLADSYLSVGRYADATNLYGRLVRQPIPSAKEAQIRTRRATAMRMDGQFDRAMVEYDRALELRPGLPEAVAGKAEILESLDRRREALALVEKALAKGLKPKPDVLLIHARLSRQSDKRADAIERIRRALEDRSLAPPDRAMLLFAFGDLQERNREYEAAFDAYAEANEIFASPFDERTYVRSIDDLIDVFAMSDLAAMPRAEQRDDAPLFIVGMMRSGTSLIEQMLGCHPQIAAGGELENVPQTVTAINRDESLTEMYPAALRSLDRSHITEFANRIASQMQEIDASATYRTDKLPVNYLHLGLISLMFPGARVVHCRRHPLDTCVSCFATRLGPVHHYATDLHALAVAYRQYDRLISHWKKVLDLRIIDVCYERIVENAEQELRRVLEYLELPWDPACMAFYKSGRVQRSASMDQVRQPLYRSSLQRHRRFETMIEPLKSKLSDLVARYEEELDRGS